MSCPIESSHNTRKTSKADSKRSSRIIISSHSSPKQFHHSNVEIERRRPSRPTQYYRQFRPTPRRLPKPNPDRNPKSGSKSKSTLVGSRRYDLQVRGPFSEHTDRPAFLAVTLQPSVPSEGHVPFRPSLPPITPSSSVGA